MLRAAVLVRLVTLTLLLCTGTIALGARIELTQTLDFKWRALTVATMQFDLSLPVTESFNRFEESGVSASQIRIIGETKGPLRWIQDYQATVEYSRSEHKELGSIFALKGLDGGEPEERRIVFVPGQLPRIEIFNDSTASQPLALKEEWLGKAENPLSAFEAILQAAVRNGSCANSIWGFDGKRRYRLEAKDAPDDGSGTAETLTDIESVTETRVKNVGHYQCTLMLYARGRDTAGSNEETKPSGWSSRFASLWPFSDSDRELIFYFDVNEVVSDKTYDITFNKIVIPTSIGAIIAQLP